METDIRYTTWYTYFEDQQRSHDTLTAHNTISTLGGSSKTSLLHTAKEIDRIACTRLGRYIQRKALRLRCLRCRRWTKYTAACDQSDSTDAKKLKKGRSRDRQGIASRGGVNNLAEAADRAESQHQSLITTVRKEGSERRRVYRVHVAYMRWRPPSAA